MPGRPKKPISILELQGTSKKNRISRRTNELIVGGDFPKPPKWLKGAALEEWRRVEQISDYAACIKESHRGMLTGYCVLWGSLEDTGKLGASEWQIFISLAGKMGMSPSDQTKIHVGQKPQENKFAKFQRKA